MILQVSHSFIYIFFLYFFFFFFFYVLKILKKYWDKDSFESILYLLLTSIKKEADKCKHEDNFYNDYCIQNYLIFFMILTLNLDKYKDFMKAIFKSEMNFFHNLIEILKQLRRSKKYIGIIMNLFLEEYKKCFFAVNKDTELENLYVKEHFSFFENFEQISFKNEISEDFFSDLLKFDLSYENYFLYNKDKLEEKQTYKLEIVQSLIRVLFSREKKKYIKEPFYEFNLIKRIIDKDMEETIEKYGDQFRTLFRKEDICDDFLKYMFFVFGNKMIIESFINPLNKLISEIEPKDRNINKEEFDNLVTEFLSRLKFDIPHILKILLKILYESIRSHFTIETDNYGPLFTTLIFNFII